jgi:hypothetical protein
LAATTLHEALAPAGVCVCQRRLSLISRDLQQIGIVTAAARRLLLGCECCYLTDVVKPRLEVLTAGLPGADIAAMVQEDPRLLFEELESSASLYNLI